MNHFVSIDERSAAKINEIFIKFSSFNSINLTFKF